MFSGRRGAFIYVFDELRPNANWSVPWFIKNKVFRLIVVAMGAYRSGGIG